MTVFVPDIRVSHGKIIFPMEYEKKIADGTVVEVEVVPKLHLYLFFLWCQLIYFSAGYSQRIHWMAPGIRLMGHMHISSRLKNEDYAMLRLRPRVSSAKENARQVRTSGPHRKKLQLLRLLNLPSGPTSATLTTQWMSEKS